MFRRIEVPGESVSWIACRSMIATGLPDAKRKKNRHYQSRCEFFFTEKGWRQCGHAVLSELRSNGFTAKVIAVKEKDPRLNIRFRDELQMVVAWTGRKSK